MVRPLRIPLHMKLFLILLGMGAAGILGYLTEPGLRPQVTGIDPKGKPTKTADGNEATPADPVTDIDPATLAPNQLPEKVTLREEIKFSDESSGLTMTVSAGSKAKLIRIQGKDAVVRPGKAAIITGAVRDGGQLRLRNKHHNSIVTLQDRIANGEDVSINQLRGRVAAARSVEPVAAVRLNTPKYAAEICHQRRRKSRRKAENIPVEKKHAKFAALLENKHLPTARRSW